VFQGTEEIALTAKHPTDLVLSDRFDAALAFAVELHRQQGRKGSRTPYVAHLLTVAGYVLEDGGTEQQAIAALLHDALEDQHHDELPIEIEAEFGPKVLAIVEGCSQDNRPGEDLDWRTRKERYLAHVREADPAVVAVSLADKLANVRSMLRDLHASGEGLWTRFNAPGGREDVRWYYTSLAAVYGERHPGPLAEEFAIEVDRLFPSQD